MLQITCGIVGCVCIKPSRVPTRVIVEPKGLLIYRHIVVLLVGPIQTSRTVVKDGPERNAPGAPSCGIGVFRVVEHSIAAPDDGQVVVKGLESKPEAWSKIQFVWVKSAIRPACFVGELQQR